MAIRNIREFGDPVLRKECKPVKEVTDRIRVLVEDMIDTMNEANGVGLAAPQVGILKQIVVIDVGEGPIVMLNPRILLTEGEQTGIEGCLSLPGKVAEVTRPMHVRAVYQDLDMQEVEIEGDGFVGNDGVVVTPTASRTLVGVTPNSFDWVFSEGTNEDNYNVETEYGLLSIVNRDAAYEITMKANSDTVEYDGEEHSVRGFEKNEFNVDDGNYTVEGIDASATGTEAGVYETEISGLASVNDSEGNDVTDQFAVSYESGTLTISEAKKDESGTDSGATPVNNGSTDNDGNTGNGGSASSGEGGQGGAGTGENADNRNNGGGNGNVGNGAVENGNAGTDRNGLTIETIPDSAVVTAAPSGYWAIANLFFMILTVIGGIYMLFRKPDDEDDDPDDGANAYAGAAYYRPDAEGPDEEPQRSSRKRLLSVIAAVLLAVISAVVFFITEDLSNSMGLFDKYSLLMAALMIASVVSVVTGNKRRNSDEEE